MMLAFQVCEKQYSLKQLNIKKLGSCFWERNQDWKNMELRQPRSVSSRTTIQKKRPFGPFFN